MRDTLLVVAFAGLAGCSFLIDVPGRLPEDPTKWECARDGTCCPNTGLFPVLDGVAAIPAFVLGLTLTSNCEDHSCSTNTELAYEVAPFVGAATLVAAAIYGVRANGRCKRLERDAAQKLLAKDKLGSPGALP